MLERLLSNADHQYSFEAVGLRTPWLPCRAFPPRGAFGVKVVLLDPCEVISEPLKHLDDAALTVAIINFFLNLVINGSCLGMMATFINVGSIPSAYFIALF